MTADLKQKLEKWLKTQGYPLEMKVAAALSKQGFSVEQGAYYSDPETKTSREIDVIASIRDDFGFLEVAFAIECKSTPEKPWVLFTSDKHMDGNRLLRYAAKSEKTRSHLVNKYMEDMKPVLGLKWFVKEQRKAYGVVAAFSTGEDPAYKGIMSALKSALSLCNNNENNSKLNFTFPVVVIDGRLFEAFLNDNEETEICEINEGFVVYHHEIANNPCSSVHIVTSHYLETFCKEAKQAVNELKALFQPEYDKMILNKKI